MNKETREYLSTLSPSDKAFLYFQCEEADIRHDRINYYLTKKERDRMRKNLSNTEAQEFEYYMRCNHILGSFIPEWLMVEGQFNEELNRTLNLLRAIETRKQQEQLLNRIYFSMKDEKEEVLSGFADDAEKKNVEMEIDSLMGADFLTRTLRETDGTRAEISEDGTIEINTRFLWMEARDSVKDLRQIYGIAKSMVQAILSFAKDYHCVDFIPYSISNGMTSIMGKDYALEVSPIYSRLLLLQRERAGDRITDYERENAIIPYYGEIEPNEFYYDLWRKELEKKAQGEGE